MAATRKPLTKPGQKSKGITPMKGRVLATGRKNPLVASPHNHPLMSIADMFVGPVKVRIPKDFRFHNIKEEGRHRLLASARNARASTSTLFPRIKTYIRSPSAVTPIKKKPAPKKP